MKPMLPNTPKTTRTHAAIAAGVALLAGGAHAQGLMSSQGVIVATNDDTIPDTAGAPMTGFTFGGSSALGDNCVMDESGKILFRGRFVDTGATVTTWNDRAYFYGSSRADLVMIIRGGDQAPGMTTGYTLRTTTGSSSSLTGSPRLTPDGKLFWGSFIFDNGGVGGITSADDECLFGGLPGSQTMLLRQGSAAPGTAGATFAQAFSSPSQQSTGMNRNGDLFFQGTLTGGDVVGTTNQSGIWAGPPSSLTMVQRKGTAADGLPGLFISSTSSSALGFMFNMNDAGQLCYEVNLDMVVGAPLPTVQNDHAIMLYTPGLGSQVFVREGDVVPGPSGATFNAITGDLWSQGVSANFLTRSGKFFFQSELRGGDVGIGVNDRALFRGGVGTLAMVARKGDPASGTDGVFGTFNNNSLLHNDAGRICFQSSLSGGTVTTADDTGVWAGQPGTLELVLREGATLPIVGGTAGGLSGTSIYYNDLGQVLFNVSITGGTNPGTSLWLFNPGIGLVPVILSGNTIEVTPGVFKTISGFGGVQFSNTDGAAMHFSHQGKLGIRTQFLDGTNAMMTLQLPPPVAGDPFCFGDGTLADHTTACPCGNNGLAGNGCAHSASADGANLDTSGSTVLDDVTLIGTNMPSTSSCIYLQGDGLDDVTFGDGVRCTGGNLIRLRTRQNVAGASTFPDSTDTVTLSERGGVVPGSSAIRYYQTYYRNAAALFCPPETFNVTNGTVILW